ncbi:MAG: DNA-binding protein WhiA [Eubacteriales bacterium]|nr:DNA-binding protein WhiA [Eubacteriales bacterium]
MSFSSEVKKEVENRHFTTKKRHSKIGNNASEDLYDGQELLIEAFLHSGTVSDPEKSCDFRIICETREEAERLKAAMGGFGLTPGVSIRKDRYIVYLKDRESVSDVLVVLGATDARLKYEEAMVLRSVKGNVQRRVNFETANITKTVSAAVSQLNDIKLIKSRHRFQELQDGLKEAAELRVKYPDASLSELAEHLPGTGKSGLNHRFRKIAKIADELRMEKLL